MTRAAKRPRVFIGSSTEAREIVRAVAAALESAGLIPVPWDLEFRAGGLLLPQLVAHSRSVDGAVLVLTPDDTVSSRDVAIAQARANVIFEAGLFAGALGLDRAVIYAAGGQPGFGDLDGLVVIDAQFPARAQLELTKWGCRLREQVLTPRLGGVVDVHPSFLESNFMTHSEKMSMALRAALGRGAAEGVECCANTAAGVTACKMFFYDQFAG